MKPDAGLWEPKFVHDCRDCKFLDRVWDEEEGTLREYDLYICTGHASSYYHGLGFKGVCEKHLIVRKLKPIGG